MKRAFSLFATLFCCAAVFAADPVVVEIDLGVADAATARTYAVEPGKPFSLTLINAVPGGTYEILKESRREKVGTRNPNPASAAGCTPPAEQIARLLASADTEEKVATAVKSRATVFTACTDAQNTELTNAIRAITTATFAGYSLKAGETMQKAFRREGSDAVWTIAIVTQGGSAAVAADAAAKAANPALADNPNLDRLLKRTADSVTLTTAECSYNDTACVPEIFINADQISTLTIKDIPTGKLKVTVTAGELFDCHALSYNFATFEKAPDRLIIPLHMARNLIGLGGKSMNGAQIEAARLYDLETCPDTGKYIDSRRFAMFRADETPAQGQTTDPRNVSRECERTEIPSVPLYVRGRAQTLDVLLVKDDGTRRTFSIPIRYQRFWLDAGGFFVFTRRTDQKIETEVVAAEGTNPERRRVTALRSENSYEPSTGIVINLHPGNSPAMAFQFGIAANQGRLPSYYLGVGARAREIGRRGLATIAVGVAMQQEASYSQIAVDEVVVPDSPRLQAQQKYGFTFPYVSISLGFSFGGVSERTNVSSSVTAPSR